MAAIRVHLPGSPIGSASGADRSYDIHCGDGLLDRVGPAVRAAGGRRAAVVSDAAVADSHGARVAASLESAGVEVVRFAVPSGETAKSVAHAERLWNAFADAAIDRGTHVVAVGGGVVGDLAGFCAAGYQRGIEVVQVPTTLVAQVDSAYGGKTGVDLPEAKNYVGAYHQPAGVIADTGLLASLPPAEIAAGMAEVIKTGLIAGGSLWARIAAGEPIDDRMIRDCAWTKIAVVASDERDGGRRQVLNLGHTVGHAIETATGYSQLRHGEAIGLGLLAELRCAGSGALRDEVSALLEQSGLPVTLAGLDVDAVIAATRLDKKRVADEVPFVLCAAPGEVTPGCPVDGAVLHAAVSEIAS